MCIFSGNSLTDVESTKIFARTDGTWQYLVYQMSYESDSDIAMILPLPIHPRYRDDAVSFINLEEYSSFFMDMERGFNAYYGLKTLRSSSSPKLKVHDIGSFEASYVPIQADFSRLDERFTIPQDIWTKLKIYDDYGFAVAKLKAGSKLIHPFVLKFKSALLSLFFPTVHVHNGEVTDKAEFDHDLYCQVDIASGDVLGWRLSSTTNVNSHQNAAIARDFMETDKCGNILIPNLVCRHKKLVGLLPNTDQQVCC